jgi:hypothetical protein
MDRRHEGIRECQGQEHEEDLFFLHDLPEVRKEVRQELRSDSGTDMKRANHRTSLTRHRFAMALAAQME